MQNATHTETVIKDIKNTAQGLLLAATMLATFLFTSGFKAGMLMLMISSLLWAIGFLLYWYTLKKWFFLLLTVMSVCCFVITCYKVTEFLK